MKIVDLNLSESSKDFLKTEGYSDLYPPQQDSIDAGILNGESILVSAPTASGKTLIAIIAILNYLSKNNGKVDSKTLSVRAEVITVTSKRSRPSRLRMMPAGKDSIRTSC